MKEITQFANGISKFSRLWRLVLFLSSQIIFAVLSSVLSKKNWGVFFRPKGEKILGCFCQKSRVFSKVKKNTGISLFDRFEL